MFDFNLSLSVRCVGLCIFALQVVINYYFILWTIEPLDHPQCAPTHTNWTAWLMLHVLMPVAIGTWPEMLFRWLTRRFRKSVPDVIFWGAARSGTTTFAQHLMLLKQDHVQFIGPFSPITGPFSHNKESFFFVSQFGYKNFQRYSMLYPMENGTTKIMSTTDASTKRTF